jgi:hypothetical protein
MVAGGILAAGQAMAGQPTAAISASGGAASSQTSPPTLTPLTATVSQDSGLEKHLYSFQIADTPQEMVGLTGTVSFTTTLNYFGEALISVNGMPGTGCAQVNGESFASYSDPGFPALVHLASFIFKSSHAMTQKQRAHIVLPNGIRVAGCIVVVLDGGGAWGPKHGYGYPVTMTSALTLATVPIPAGTTPQTVPVAVGGEFLFGGNDLPSGSGLVTILRVNPQLATNVALDAVFGSISASGFDGSSGELVPKGSWGARVATSIYPNAACVAAFPLAPSFQGLLNFSRVTVGTGALPPGGLPLYVASLQGNGTWPQQTSYFTPTSPTTMNPGDCLVTVHRSGGNGVIDLEDQSTAVVRPVAPAH